MTDRERMLQRAEQAERATAADEFRIISEAALAIWGWQDERYKRVLQLLEAGASIDAAMTLVLDGRVILNIAEDGISTAIADGTQGCAATPALALCAAALRARAHTSKENQ